MHHSIWQEILRHQARDRRFRLWRLAFVYIFVCLAIYSVVNMYHRAYGAEAGWGDTTILPPPPPPRYDHYSGPYEIRHDLPGEDLWGWTDIPWYPGGPCIIHTVPPTWMTRASYYALIRHELGHCAGGAHPTQAHQDKWVPIPPGVRPNVPAELR